MFLSITVILCLILGSYAGDLPPNITKCKVDDNVCVAQKIEEVLRKYPHGNPDIGLPNMSALPIKNVIISRASGSSPIQMNLKFVQFVTDGLQNGQVLNTTGWTKNPKIFEGNFFYPKLVVKGDYESDGRILFLSMNGRGKGLFELTNCHFNVKTKVVLEKRSNGKNYAKITKLKLVLSPEKAYTNMDNLVNGSPELSKTINDVINENWRDVWQEISNGLNAALGEVLENLLTGIFNELSYDDFYAE
ncbi:circadian clock-controlled protein daywake-like [Musca vetustissima]|uniref:circadian clock-controlled protein daywake-like n=1 Tax=Musca vetustissima TaxID=27455 RepID=UPI002AB62DDA|nr:circadian clock-controlled protein daywake-like [Musca vetustissima]